MDLVTRHIWSERARSRSRLDHLVFVLLDEVHLQCGGLCHVLFVAGDAPHHSARTNPVRGHEHVLFETIASLVGERIHGVWRSVYLFKCS